MPHIFREITANGELIPARVGYKIVITHVWIKLANGWTAGNLMGLTWGLNHGTLMFPRDNRGVTHGDCDINGPHNTPLYAYYRVVSGELVYIDITYRYSP